MEWRMLVTNKTADAAVELAVDRGWLLADGDKGVCLTVQQPLGGLSVCLTALRFQALSLRDMRLGHAE
jgi:hypothetical protein